MASRYSRIRQAQQLAESLRNLRLYEDTPRQPRVNSRGARDPSKNTYVVPYGLDLETDEVARVRNSVQGYTALATRINQAGTQGAITDALGTKTVRVVGGYRPARLVWFRNATRSVQEKTSDVTKDKYLKYNGDRSSCAFGRNVATDNLYDAFNNIKTAVLQANPTLEVNRVSLTPEVIRYNL
jgi:hypothetical protein